MKSTYVYIALVIALIVVLVVVRNSTAGTRNNIPRTALDTFSQCLTDAGAKFYGAYWCPHCQDQKKLLGESKLMPYIECSTPNGQGQVKVCADAGITGYPTWVFADGSQVDGAMELAALGEKTLCAVPEGT